MKIAISTIAKNEEHNVEGFVDSCKDADLISVLDTGSTDNTVDLLKKYNALAGETKIEPFRFDEARNQALDKLPEDIDVVVSIDMDERMKAGWREELEKIWTPESETVSYWYLAGDGVDCWRSKIFRKKGYRWYNPVHEIPLLEGKKQPKLQNCNTIIVEHLQKGIRDYEPLLNGIINAGEGDESTYSQRGHEHMKKKEWQKAIEDFTKSISMSKEKTDKCEYVNCPKCIYEKGYRALLLIDTAVCEKALGKPLDDVLSTLIRATAESPKTREPWVYLAELWFALGNYPSAYGTAMNALGITDNGLNSKHKVCWGDYPKQIADKSYSNIIKPKICK